MIVVDTNIIVYFLLIENKTPQARKVYQRDSDWVAPFLWKSEFHNVLSLYLRRNNMTLDRALELMQEAEEMFQQKEYRVDSKKVLHLVNQSTCSAYDCEFVALASDLGVPLITSDQKILHEFQSIAVSLNSFAGF